MADKIPVKAVFTGADVTALGEYATGDTIPVASGGTGSTGITGIVKGSGTAYSAAVAGTDYAAATTGTNAQLLANNGSGGFSNVTVGSGLSLTTGTLTAPSTMTYPGAGIANSTGTAWGTSYTTSGTGTVVALATSPSFTTPTLGVATATTVNKVTLTAPATGSTLTIADGKTLTASNTLTFTGTDASSVAFGAGGTVFYTSGLGTNVATFLATPSSANLAAALTDKTGTGANVFGTSPTITGTVAGGATYTNPTLTGASITAANSNTVEATSGPTSTQIAGNRNKIINGAMAIDQRNAGASQTITAAAALAYTVDRWYAYSTGANVTGQRVAGSTASSQYNYQFTGAASTTVIGFGQRIESFNSYDLAGNSATLSVFLANSLLTTVTWTAYYASTANSFGTLASPTVTSIATGTFTVTSTLTRYNTTISIPSAATTGIQIVFTVGAQTSGTWTIGQVQLEKGATATPFENRFYGTELALCQRYYWYTNSNMGFAQTGNICAAGAVRTPVQMRASPTIDAGAVFQVSAGLVGTVGLLNSTGFAVSPDGVVPYNTANNWTVTVGIQFIGSFNAEL